jgi:hypothetical protein
LANPRWKMLFFPSDGKRLYGQPSRRVRIAHFAGGHPAKGGTPPIAKMGMGNKNIRGYKILRMKEEAPS